MSSLLSPLLHIEQTLLSLPNLFCLLSQLSFFSLCDHLLLKEHKISSLYTLIFYNVITYCLSYVTELIHKDWNMYVTVSQTSNLKHLSLTATKLVLEWAKAVTFLMTLVFLLLVFTLEQALTKYFPTELYLTVTFLHYASSEKFFVTHFPKFLAWLDLDSLDGLEEYYSPVILKLFTITLSALVTSASFLTGHYAAIPLSSYLNIYLATRYTQMNLLPALREQTSLLKPYRPASQQELKDWNDICPICLTGMSMPRARVTQCFHLFHGECLRKYLRAKVWSSVCPMCKKSL